MSTAPDDSIATAIQLCAVAELEAAAEFSGVPILGRRRTNIQNDIDQAINELGGACIYVFPGLPVKINGSTGTPYADEYELRVRCIENDTLNATLPPYQVLAEYIVRRLFGRQWTAIEGMNPLYPAERPLEAIDDTERLILDVVWRTSLGFLPRIGG